MQAQALTIQKHSETIDYLCEEIGRLQEQVKILKEESEELKDKIQVHGDAMGNVEWQVSTLYFAFQDQFPSFN